MASTWWGHLPLLMDNGTAHLDNSSCFSAMQSTVLKGVNFGGVPIVLLLDFIVFLVGSMCVWQHNVSHACMKYTVQSVVIWLVHTDAVMSLFVAVYLCAGAAIDIYCDQKETVGLWETCTCCRDWRVCKHNLLYMNYSWFKISIYLYFDTISAVSAMPINGVTVEWRHSWASTSRSMRG